LIYCENVGFTDKKIPPSGGYERVNMANAEFVIKVELSDELKNEINQLKEKIDDLSRIQHLIIDGYSVISLPEDGLPLTR